MTDTDTKTILEEIDHNTEIKHQIHRYMKQGFNDAIDRINEVEAKHDNET